MGFMIVDDTSISDVSSTTMNFAYWTGWQRTNVTFPVAKFVSLAQNDKVMVPDGPRSANFADKVAFRYPRRPALGLRKRTEQATASTLRWQGFFSRFTSSWSTAEDTRCPSPNDVARVPP